MADRELRTPSREIQDATCEVCPAQLLAFGRFDVAARPGPDNQYDPEAGWRVNRMTRKPTCVHPYRVGLPPALYASEGAPLPPTETSAPEPDQRDLELPEDPSLLEAWLVAVLRCAPPERMAAALLQAEVIATSRFDSRTVVAAMRRVMTGKLGAR